MKDPVYKLIELTGSSTISIEDAVEKAIKRADKTLKKLSWFQVIETRGRRIRAVAAAVSGGAYRLSAGTAGDPAFWRCQALGRADA